MTGISNTPKSPWLPEKSHDRHQWHTQMLPIAHFTSKKHVGLSAPCQARVLGAHVCMPLRPSWPQIVISCCIAGVHQTLPERLLAILAGRHIPGGAAVAPDLSHGDGLGVL